MTTSYGQTLLREVLLRWIKGTPVENARPACLRGLELDFYYEEYGLGFEFQGDQHFLPVFGTDNLIRQQGNDSLKRKLCRENGIILVNFEACDLAKPRLKNKIFACLNWYRPIEDRKERRVWFRSFFIRRPKDRPGVKEQARDYCAIIRNKFGGITAIPKKHTRKRAEAASRFVSRY